MRRRSLLALCLALSAGACSDPARNNPVDPGTSVTMRIVGPDEIGTLNRDVPFDTEPGATGPTRIPFTWSTSAPDRTTIDDRGVFSASAEGEYTITAEYRHIRLTHTVTVRQRAGGLVLATDRFFLHSIGHRVTPGAFLVDSTGHPTGREEPPIVLTSSDTTVVRIDGREIVTVGAGIAFVTVSAGALSKGIRVEVEPRPALLEAEPNYLLFSEVGQTRLFRYFGRDSVGTLMVPELYEFKVNTNHFGITRNPKTGVVRLTPHRTGHVWIHLVARAYRFNTYVHDSVLAVLPGGTAPTVAVRAVMLPASPLMYLRTDVADPDDDVFSVKAEVLRGSGQVTSTWTLSAGASSSIQWAMGATRVRITATDAPLNRTVIERDIHVSDPAASPVIHEFTTTRVSADTWRARAVISDPDGTLDELHVVLEKAGPLMGLTYFYPTDLCDMRGRTSVTCEFDLHPGSTVTPLSYYTAIAFDSSGNASTPVSGGLTGY